MDGIFQRKDRDGYYITWVDAQGRRRKRKEENEHDLPATWDLLR